MIAQNVEAPNRRRRAHPPADNLRKDGRNLFATMAVFAGIASWVPLVIVLALPLTYICATLAVITAVRSDARKGLKAAWVGVVLATVALLVHLAIVSVGFIFGWAGSLFQHLLEVWG